MKTVKLVSQKRTGLFQDHSAGVAPLVYEARATIPAVESLQAAGAIVEPLAEGYRITFGPGAKMPSGLVAVHTNASEGPHLGLRLEIEPEYPQEHPDYWSQVAFTPCPVCGAPVVWYEAGYVPGYRVCAKKPHHHSLAR